MAASEMTGEYRPAWWLPGGHLQTLWPALLRRPPRVAVARERLELEDGDFLDLDWLAEAPAGGPVVILVHGLEGSLESHYLPGLMRTLADCGMRPVLMYHRGCSGEPNRTDRRYTGGDTGDLAWVAEILRTREPDMPLTAVGFSLGGNLLLKWLGETGADNPLAAAAAVSPPFRLDRAADRLEHGLSRLYQEHLLRALRASVTAKYAHRPQACPVPLDRVRSASSFRAFDDAFTAPVHGYAGVDDYYARGSCRPYLRGIAVPTLVLHALDDPFTTPDAVPAPGELSGHVQLELHRHGGHVGFVIGNLPGRPRYWIEERVPAFLCNTVTTPETPARGVVSPDRTLSS
ncbi:hydrolase [Thiohalorhabdus methylotrophus]|uniref:Hydrolase n=1 Tax=Thiohalorhabdus methylotrophus TaxID=3242694 RepID=A0ABV4TSM6_9GAMM